MRGRILLSAVLFTTLGCGGGDSPTVPTSPAPIPAAAACDAVGSIGTAGSTIGILSGAVCTPRGPVVKLNMRQEGFAAGSCSGTLISARAILTAAHCLDDDITEIRVWPGEGPEFLAESFVAHPQFNKSTLQFDVGVVLLGEDFPRAPAAILTSRPGLVGEAAIVAGFGRDENSDTTALRAGSTTISNVTATRLESIYAPPASSICSGDSGGPIFLSEGGTWVVAGVSSATTQSACNTGTNFYQAVFNEQVRAFILDRVPSAARR